MTEEIKIDPSLTITTDDYDSPLRNMNYSAGRVILHDDKVYVKGKKWHHLLCNCSSPERLQNAHLRNL